MKNILPLFLAVGLGLVSLGTESCSRSDAQTATPFPNVSPGDAPTVAVTRATRTDLSRGISLTAEFKPWQEVDIHAKVAGYVRQIDVDVGDHVKAGDVLAVLEIPELEEDLKKAEAAVLSARQEVKSAQAAFGNSDQIYKRLQAAGHEAPGLVAQQDLDTALARKNADAATLEAARQKVVEAQDETERMRTMFSYAKITAPFDGVITRRYADTGALIPAGTASNAGTMPLVSLAENQLLRLEFPVPESAVANVRVGDEVEVNVASLGQTFTAKVSRFAQKVDTATRTMLTEADVENPDFRFIPGMYATVQVTLAEKKSALAIPIECLSNGGKPTVLIFDKNREVEEREVTVGLETPNLAEILSGLSEGDLVVLGSRSSIQLGRVSNPKEIDGKRL